jgi:hypothetical protein
LSETLQLTRVRNGHFLFAVTSISDDVKRRHWKDDSPRFYWLDRLPDVSGVSRAAVAGG